MNRKKNFEFGIKALCHCNLSKPVELRLYGPPEDQEYLNEMLMHDGENDRVSIRYMGSLNHDELSAQYLASHFLLLPTLHENFGHSIAEAWAHGCPTLIADTTPWRGLEEKGVGRVWSLKEAEWVEGLTETLAMSAADWSAMSVAARAFFDSEVRTEAMREANLRIFQA
jgi:glycosyltransferase involved in cell wall biosynthesis